MALILDTAGLPPERRAAAVAEVIRFSSSVPTRMVYNCPDDEVSARFEYFTFGETHLLKSQNSSQGLVVTSDLLKGAESDVLVVSVKLSGTASFTQASRRPLRGGDLFVTNLWRPFEFLDDGGDNTAFYIPSTDSGCRATMRRAPARWPTRARSPYSSGGISRWSSGTSARCRRARPRP